LKLYPVFILQLLLWNFQAKSQTDFPIGFYNSAQEFQRGAAFIKCGFTPKPYPKLPLDTLILPNIYRLIPKDIEISYRYFKFHSILAWDGVDLYLNLRKLRMANDFLKVGKPKPYIVFLGREPVGQNEAVGSYYRAQRNSDTDFLAHKLYVLDLKTGRAHALIPSTVERLLESFPELLELYSRDPNWNADKTMKTYIELLNEMLEIRQY